MTELQQIFMTNDSTGIVWNAIYANKAALEVRYNFCEGMQKKRKRPVTPCLLLPNKWGG